MQARPHPPQCALELDTSVHTPAHRSCPLGQAPATQLPLVQTCPLPHCRAQAPQFALLVRSDTSQPVTGSLSQSA